MTRLSPAATTRRVSPPVSHASPSFVVLLGDRRHLRTALLNKRTTIAGIEAAWVAGSEADAAVGRGGTVRMDDRETWDQTTWDRYLAAATNHEPDYMPRIKQLLCEIDNIERLLALPSGSPARVA